MRTPNLLMLDRADCEKIDYPGYAEVSSSPVGLHVLPAGETRRLHPSECDQRLLSFPDEHSVSWKELPRRRDRWGVGVGESRMPLRAVQAEDNALARTVSAKPLLRH
jgi:hypothetical protein